MARPTGSKNMSSRVIKDIIDECVDMGDVVGKLVELVNGVTVSELNSKGKEIIYTQKPDAFAAKILLEYRYGKPNQSISHSGEITSITIEKTILRKPNDMISED